MVMHAARHYGVRALGVTLSRKQAEWAQKKIAESGLSDLAEVRHLDYRDVSESGFDAVSSIGLTEHIGAAALPSYVRSLQEKLRPGGRLLNHCITRPDNLRPPRIKGFFDRSCSARGTSCRPSTTTVSRSGTRRTSASTTRGR
jgi:cyclopropane-fatty-acyl-phospholipid synthase